MFGDMNDLVEQEKLMMEQRSGNERNTIFEKLKEDRTRESEEELAFHMEEILSPLQQEEKKNLFLMQVDLNVQQGVSI